MRGERTCFGDIPCFCAFFHQAPPQPPMPVRPVQFFLHAMHAKLDECVGQAERGRHGPAVFGGSTARKGLERS